MQKKGVKKFQAWIPLTLSTPFYFIRFNFEAGQRFKQIILKTVDVFCEQRFKTPLKNTISPFPSKLPLNHFLITNSVSFYNISSINQKKNHS